MSFPAFRICSEPSPCCITELEQWVENDTAPTHVAQLRSMLTGQRHSNAGCVRTRQVEVHAQHHWWAADPLRDAVNRCDAEDFIVHKLVPAVIVAAYRLVSGSRW